MKSQVNKTSAVMRIYRAGHFCYRHHLRICAKFFYACNYLLFNCVIPSSAALGKDVNIAHGVGIVIHHEAQIGEGTKIYQNVTIGGGKIRVGAHCLVGTGAVVLADVGDCVKIGANAVMTKPLPSHVTAVGIPAQIVGKEEKLHGD